MMAAISVPAPGTKLGPCEGQCEHLDCAENRRMARALCAACHVLISYDAPKRRWSRALSATMIKKFATAAIARATGGLEQEVTS